MDIHALAQVTILNELTDSHDEKSHRGKTRRWVKRRSDQGYFNKIIKELRIEDRTSFRDMFRIDVADFDTNTIFQVVSSGFFLHCLACNCLCLKTDSFVFRLWKKTHLSVRNMLHCRCFALIAVLKGKMMDEKELTCIQHENIVG